MRSQSQTHTQKFLDLRGPVDTKSDKLNLVVWVDSFGVPKTRIESKPTTR